MIDDSKKDIDHLQPEMVDVCADTGVLAVHRPSQTPLMAGFVMCC